MFLSVLPHNISNSGTFGILNSLLKLLYVFQAQIIELTANIWWCSNIEKHFAEGKTVESVEDVVDKTLSLLADSVLSEQPAIRRKKIEALVYISSFKLLIVLFWFQSDFGLFNFKFVNIAIF